MSFPSSIPSYAGFTSGHTLQADNHASQHNSEQADIIAIATKVGTGSSTSTNNTVLRGNGSGTSAWAQVAAATDITGTLAVSNGGTGTTTSTGSGSVVLGTSPTISTPTISNPTISSGGSWAGSPTITTPTIASFTNSQHNHQNAAGGGLLDLSVIDATAWISWTPSWTNITISSSTVEAKYRQIGKTVHIRLLVTFAGGEHPSTGSNVTYTLPVAQNAQYYASATDRIWGVGTALHPGVSAWVVGTRMTDVAGSGKADIIAHSVSGSFVTHATLNSTVPFSWTDGDKLSISGTYEAA